MKFRQKLVIGATLLATSCGADQSQNASSVNTPRRPDIGDFFTQSAILGVFLADPFTPGNTGLPTLNLTLSVGGRLTFLTDSWNQIDLGEVVELTNGRLLVKHNGLEVEIALPTSIFIQNDRSLCFLGNITYDGVVVSWGGMICPPEPPQRDEA